MKMIKLIGGLLFIAIICASCKKKFCCDGISFTIHPLYLSFQDTSGNDLVKGIGFDVWRDGGYVTGGEEDVGGIVKPELFTLEFVFENGIPNPNLSISPLMALQKETLLEAKLGLKNDYLSFYPRSFSDQPFVEKITFKMTCPYIFRDYAKHDIVTWWKKHPSISPICYRIEFEGKEITEITYNDSSGFYNGSELSFATVVLDSK